MYRLVIHHPPFPPLPIFYMFTWLYTWASTTLLVVILYMPILYMFTWLYTSPDGYTSSNISSSANTLHVYMALHLGLHHSPGGYTLHANTLHVYMVYTSPGGYTSSTISSSANTLHVYMALHLGLHHSPGGYTLHANTLHVYMALHLGLHHSPGGYTSSTISSSANTLVFIWLYTWASTTLLVVIHDIGKPTVIVTPGKLNTIDCVPMSKERFAISRTSGG